MSPLTATQVKGLIELTQDAVDAVTAAVAETHLALAHQPYAVLAQIPLVAVPAIAIEAVQQTVTATVYASIRAVNCIAGATARQIAARLADEGDS
ncbi:MAG: hypothetical protein K1X65_08855 [Caldilineales bacterium]|nr:hypothetical protein [Caldilineales bacterium]MCW5859769.1 hypothetical protein [Caldilineales bacterium]